MTNSIAVTPETLPAIMWQNQPVITTELLAEIYGTAIGNIQKNFGRNVGRFIEGVHFFLLKGADLKEFKANRLKDGQLTIHRFAKSLYLWTERGTVRHAKILDTDNAWAVQDRLEDFYFTKHQANQPQIIEAKPKTLNTAMLRHITKQINWLVKNQCGTTYASLGGMLLDKFNVNERRAIPFEKYGEVCALLNCEPDPKALQGELLESPKREFTPPAGKVLIDAKEYEALKRPNNKMFPSMTFSSPGDAPSRWLMDFNNGFSVISYIHDNMYIGTAEDLLYKFAQKGIFGKQEALEMIEKISKAAKFEA